MALRIVIPCCTHDQHQAVRLIKWIAELGKVDAKGVLCCARDCKVSEMMELMKEAFTETKYLEDAENIKSDWSAPHNNPKSAEGPNSLFKQVSWYFSLKDQNPWMFLEPDAYPVRRDWYELMSREWDLAVKEGKQFVGAQVASPGSDVPTHMSGVAIYHPDTPSISQNAVNNGKIAFDIAGAPDFMKRARFTKAIVHKFRGPEFDSQRDLDKHCPEGTVCYHANKSGSILHWLRIRLGMTPAGDGAPPVSLLIQTTRVEDVWEFRGGKLQLVA